MSMGKEYTQGERNGVGDGTITSGCLWIFILERDKVDFNLTVSLVRNQDAFTNATNALIDKSARLAMKLMVQFLVEDAIPGFEYLFGYRVVFWYALDAFRARSDWPPLLQDSNS